MRWYVKPLWLTWLFACAMWHVMVRVAVALGVLAALIGGLAVAESFHEERLPPIRPLRAAPRVVGRPKREQLRAMNRDELWESMRPALAILDRVSPPIADWTRGKWDWGQLVFVTSRVPYYAAYHPFGGFLAVSMDGLLLPDAEIACMLGHEYRHSRQPVLPLIQAEIVEWIGRADRKRWAVEAEAYAFEKQIRIAIRGSR